MMDKLTELFEAWQAKAGPDAILFQAFQAGLTTGAVSMRQRAMKVVADNTDRNKIMNAIGGLSDIPQ